MPGGRREVPFAFIEALCGRLNAKANFGLKWKVLRERGRAVAVWPPPAEKDLCHCANCEIGFNGIISRLKTEAKCQIRNDPSTRVICSFNSEIVMLLARFLFSVRQVIFHQVKQITDNNI